MEEITMGIRYQPLGDPTASAEVSIWIRHWVLVFTGKEYAFRIEANKDSSEQHKILMEVNPCPQSYHAFRLGTFYGEWPDLQRILEVHPQRGTIYSEWYNNCQHFVAIYLLFLNAFANHANGRYFIIDSGDRYASIKNALKMSGRHVWNNPNCIMAGLKLMAITSAGATTGAAVIAAEATVPATVSAGGLAGWLGFTNVVMVPAAYASFAAFCVPIAVGITGITGGAIWKQRNEWKNKTLFDNPLIIGYPLGYYPALSSPEVQARPGNSDTFTFLSNNSTNVASVSLVGSVIAARYFSNPTTAIGAADASDLFRLAGQLLE